MKQMLANFKNPGAEFRGAPFWAWNAKLDPEELVRQIRIFKEMGFGGFYMHARIGLNTEYLSKEWFRCIHACVDEAKKLGLIANLYDEDRWPSGGAGSFVTRDDQYKMRFLVYEILNNVDESTAGGETLAWFTASVTGEKEHPIVRQVRKEAHPEQFSPRGSRKLLRFARVLGPSSTWFNGATYLDTLNPDAVKKFVETTHETYRKEVGDEFGKSVKAIFSDEPSFWHSGPAHSLSWTDAIPARYKELYGEDITDYLPEIFFASVKKVSTARHRFYNIITEYFVQAFARTIGEWCDENGLAMTGHIFEEDALALAVNEVGSPMRFYEYMQMPGIDFLTEHWCIFNTIKQCTSMARQFGKKWRLSETYGCTGWDFPFFGHKALGDLQYALGINVRCQHLAWYSAEAEAKRDYPASISYQSSWYKKYPLVEDYFARLGAILSEGEEIRELLVIHPIESAWMRFDLFREDRGLKVLDKQFVSITNTLLAQKLDFDFGEEEILSRYGAVNKTTLQVNKASYRAVLIPELDTIRQTTLDLLAAFVKAGGTVLYLGDIPAYLDGALSDIPAKIYKKFKQATLAEAVSLLSPSVRRVSVADAGGKQIPPILARLADTGKSYTVFLCNYGKNFSSEPRDEKMVRERSQTFAYAQVAIHVPQRGNVYELDALTGKIYVVPAEYTNGAYVLQTSFNYWESHLYVITEENLSAEVKPVPAAVEKREKLPRNGWDYQLDEDNVLVLDKANWRADGVFGGKEQYILSIDNQLRDMLQQRHRAGDMIQPWLRDHTPPEKMLDLELTYNFQIKDVPAKDCQLALEHPEFYQILLNGTVLKNEVICWWIDRSFQCINIPCTLLQKGRNTLSLRSKYHEKLPGLEAMFLLGDFGVMNDTLVTLPKQLMTGSWTEQGLPNYAGNITYSRTVQVPDGGRVLEFAKWRGVLLGVTINDGEEQLLPWPPYRVELPAGEIQLKITVYGSRRNALGPFYGAEAWPAWTGPGVFKETISPIRQLVPCGLLTAPELCLIK
ncbi:MAG: hypothetical protein IKB16_10615 [Lentisphaeria bacterium]|nr:hypothetical protein [Lentisphaeria bacterium]